MSTVSPRPQHCTYLTYTPAILPSASPALFSTLGFLASIGGLTLLLSVLSDMLAFLLTAHLRIGYELTRAVYWAAGVKLGGGLLWGLFRGKSHVPLRIQPPKIRKSQANDATSSVTALIRGLMTSTSSSLARYCLRCLRFYSLQPSCIMYSLRE